MVHDKGMKNSKLYSRQKALKFNSLEMFLSHKQWLLLIEEYMDLMQIVNDTYLRCVFLCFLFMTSYIITNFYLRKWATNNCSDSFSK